MTNLYYKAVAISTLHKIKESGHIRGDYYKRFGKRATYLTKSYGIAQTYAKENRGIVLVIDMSHIPVQKSGHTNQYVTFDVIPKDRIVGVNEV